VTRVEDMVNSLPQAFAAQGGQVSNGSNGTATVNLRGLGASRTLVLIDGRRLGPGNPSSATSAVADLNFIPSSLVERVDVLTGGASGAPLRHRGSDSTPLAWGANPPSRGEIVRARRRSAQSVTRMRQVGALNIAAC
jgi:hypothetical protein